MSTIEEWLHLTPPSRRWVSHQSPIPQEIFTTYYSAIVDLHAKSDKATNKC